MKTHPGHRTSGLLAALLALLLGVLTVLSSVPAASASATSGHAAARQSSTVAKVAKKAAKKPAKRAHKSAGKSGKKAAKSTRKAAKKVVRTPAKPPVKPVVKAVVKAPVSAGPAVVVRGCPATPGGKALGAYYSDAQVQVYACGPRPTFDGAKSSRGPVVRPFVGSSTYYEGYQCIELVARYLAARYDAAPGYANGSQAVDRYAAVYPTKFVKINNGTVRQAPRKGDVLSLSTSKSFNDVGHTGIVSSSTVNSAGNGTIRAVEQNFGGKTGTSGYHDYPVAKWRVVYTSMPHVKWLRAR
jgi:hypothetical protein